jgi:hypothetical protein
MSRPHRNVDIFVAGGAALLGGAAYVAHVPGPVQVVLGIALFFAPGYLWSEAILIQRLSTLERFLTSAGLALIFPIIGGFLFYGLRIPLFRSAWVGMLVVLTLLGVVAVAVQRLRQPLDDPRPVARGPRPGSRPRAAADRTSAGRVAPVHGVIYGVAAVVALGAVALSVHGAETQKQPGTTVVSLSPLLTDAARADIVVVNHEGATEQYDIKLYRKGKLATTWNHVTLASGQTWKQVVDYTVHQGDGILVDVYLLPDSTKPVGFADNGEVKNPKLATPEVAFWPRRLVR